jgi:putative flippase GtrA
MRQFGQREACPPVSSIRELYGRFRHLIHEGAKFLVVGAVGTVVTFAIANALNGIGKYWAVTIATIVATVVTFLGNRFWSFKHRQGQGTTRETAVFLVLNGIGLLIYYGCIFLVQDAAGLSGKLWYNFALVVGTGLGTLFRFWSYRKWVWTAPGSEPLHSDGVSPGGPEGPRGPQGPGGPDGRGGPQEPRGPEQERLTPAASGRAPGAHRRT